MKLNFKQITSFSIYSRKMSVHDKCPYTEFFLVHIFPYSVWIRENRDQKKLRIWAFFRQCVVLETCPLQNVLFLKSLHYDHYLIWISKANQHSRVKRKHIWHDFHAVVKPLYIGRDHIRTFNHALLYRLKFHFTIIYQNWNYQGSYITLHEKNNFQN